LLTREQDLLKVKKFKIVGGNLKKTKLKLNSKGKGCLFLLFSGERCGDSGKLVRNGGPRGYLGRKHWEFRSSSITSHRFSLLRKTELLFSIGKKGRGGGVLIQFV
jgi:hypothetical protein